MTIATPSYHIVFFDPCPLNFGDGMTRETITPTVPHFGRIRAVTLNARQHRFVPLVMVNIFKQRRMARHAIPRTSQRPRSYKKYCK